jgi:hypothetical protein
MRGKPGKTREKDGMREDSGWRGRRKAERGSREEGEGGGTRKGNKREGSEELAWRDKGREERGRMNAGGTRRRNEGGLVRRKLLSGGKGGTREGQGRKGRDKGGEAEFLTLLSFCDTLVTDIGPDKKGKS